MGSSPYIPYSTGVGTHVGTNEDATATAVQIGADGPIYIHQCKIDASLNPKEDIYVRFWNAAAAGSHTNGTHDAIMLLYCRRGTVQEYDFMSPMLFDVGCHYAAGGDQGMASGATNPTGTVKISFVTSTS